MTNRRIYLIAPALCVLLLSLFGCDLLITRLPIIDDPSQGIFGTVMFLPGVCLEDPENPGECLNGPFPGQASFVIRERLDQPDLGIHSPVIQNFDSNEDGSFRVELPPGKYCIWQMNACTPVDVEPDRWTEIPLTVALP